MKPLTRITVILEDGTKVGGAEVRSLGDVEMTLVRDEMGGVKVLSAELKASEDYEKALADCFAMATKYHEKMTELMALGQMLMTDLHYLHKFIAPEA